MAGPVYGSWCGRTTGPARTVMVDMVARRAQEAHAAAAMARSHDALLAAGYEWDGMDGYTAPAGTTVEELSLLLVTSPEEPKK